MTGASRGSVLAAGALLALPLVPAHAVSALTASNVIIAKFFIM